MFESLTDKLSKAMKSLRGQAKLTEKNIEEALREVRMALLEADVHIQVTKTFLAAGEGEGPGRRGPATASIRPRPSSTSSTRN